MTTYAALIPFALAVVLAPAPAPAAEPITHEDVWLMRRLDAPALSPDGRWAVVSVSEPAYVEEEEVSDLWLVAADGGQPPRRLTSTASGESDVAWSPDGGHIAFAAKRGDDEESQIYLLDMSGPGEARRLTNLSGGAAHPAWSPDGTLIAFESRVFPGAADDEANRQAADELAERPYNASVYEGFPIRHWDHWRDERRVHLFIQPADGSQPAKDLLAGSELVKKPGYSGRPTRSGTELQAEWAPDGASLVFVATDRRDQAARAFVPYDLYRIATAGGEPERLTSTGSVYGDPTFSPDGASLYALWEPINEFVYNSTQVVRFGWPRPGAPEILTAALDRPVEEYVFAPGGGSLFVLVTDSGRRRVLTLPAAGGEARILDTDSRGAYAGLAAGGSADAPSLVARWEDSTHPAEIVRIDPATGKHQALTAFNSERAAGIDWQPYRELWFTSSKGRRIHSWLVLPPAFDESKKYPLIVAIHGGPHSTWLDTGHVRWHPQLLAAPGYVVLMPDYSGSVGYGETFARHIQGDPLATAGEELLEAADEALDRFDFVDGRRQAAIGASYGGHLVNWLQATTDRFRCLVGHAGLIDLEGQWATSDAVYHREVNNGGPPWGESEVWRQQSPSTYADRFQTPVLLTIGEYDYRVPLNQTLAAWTYLKRQQVPSRLIVFHDAGHWIMKGGDARFFWEQLHAWLAEHLGGGSQSR